MTQNIVDLHRELAAMRQVATEQQAEISAMQLEHKKLQGRFTGCAFHGDEFDACIQYSGQAPCEREEA